LLSLANASLAFTLSETKVFAPLRAWLKVRAPFLGELVSCGYCLGHWIALVLVILYRPRLFHFWAPLDYLLTTLVIAWLSAFQWATLSWLVTKAGK